MTIAENISIKSMFRRNIPWVETIVIRTITFHRNVRCFCCSVKDAMAIIALPHTPPSSIF
jgi:hypothetical protein